VVADTGAFVGETESFTYQPEGRIDSVSPAQGQDGTKVIIEGLNLRAHGKHVVNVTLAGVYASIVAESNTKVAVIAMHGNAQVGDVVLTANTGATVTLVDGFEYAVAGSIDGAEPSSGQYGTRVVISGSALLGGGSDVARLTLGGIDVESVGAVGADAIEVVVSDADPGSGAIVIMSDSGAVVSKESAWEYTNRGVVKRLMCRRAWDRSEPECSSPVLDCCKAVTRRRR
jgi:hypothetical protein